MFRWLMATILPYVMERIEAATMINVQAGLNVASATRNKRSRIAKAATLGAIDKKAVTGVGHPDRYRVSKNETERRRS